MNDSATCFSCEGGATYLRFGRRQGKNRRVFPHFPLIIISDQLPFVHEFISERVSWLALHDIGFGFFVGQRNGRHLRVTCCKI